MPKTSPTKLAQKRNMLSTEIQKIVLASVTPQTVRQIAYAVPCSVGAAQKIIETDKTLFGLFANGKIALPDTARGRHRWLTLVDDASKIAFVNKAQRAISIPMPERLEEITDPSIREEVTKELALNREAAVRENTSPKNVIESVQKRDGLRIDAALRQQHIESTNRTEIAQLRLDVRNMIEDAEKRWESKLLAAPRRTSRKPQAVPA